MLGLLLAMAIEFSPESVSVPNKQPQLAVRSGNVAVAYGSGNTVLFASSADGGANWSAPARVATPGKLSLGARRGPRIAITAAAIVITAIAGEKGGGADGDVLSWRSIDGGKTWSAASRVNDVPASAREGLHAMAAVGDHSLFVTWLDLRGEGTRLYSSISTDDGKTWSPNRLVYASPSGTICQCCHPTVTVGPDNRIFVMFRNALDGNRDMYVLASSDGGRTFSPAQKLGSGSWKLDACPMDGGALAIAPDGDVASVWRRDQTLYRSGIGGQEQILGPGRHPVVTATPRGLVSAWTQGNALHWIPAGESSPQRMEGNFAFLSLVALPNGDVLAAGERSGSIFITPLR